MAHTLAEWALHIGRMSALIELARGEAIEHACVIVEEEAKRVIGTYDYGWPQLAASTQADRSSHGYPANEPLLRDGSMRDSISHYTDGGDGYVGSPSKIALYQELGTDKIPPRSFLAGATRAKEAEIADLGVEAMKKAVSGALFS